MHSRYGLLLYSVCKEVLENAMKFFCHFCQKRLFEFVFFIIIGQQDVKLGKICVSCAKKPYKKSTFDFDIGFAETCSRLLISPKEMELVDFCQAHGV